MSERTSRNNLVIFADPHCGCKFGLCPPEPIPLQDGGTYQASPLQRAVWGHWDEFWGEWVPHVCHNEPYTVVLNGDSIDGVHHGATTQVSHNLADQAKIAEMCLKPVVEGCEGRFYMLRGTESHVGPSGVEEERLAKTLGAVPDKDGRRSRYELWIRVGKGLCHIMHHIGTSGASHYESTAVMKELAEEYTEAGRNREEPPDVVARSHRHRNIEVRVPTQLGYGISFVTAGWQLKTPFVFRIAGARITTPQVGGSFIRQGDSDLYTRHKVWSMPRAEVETA